MVTTVIRVGLLTKAKKLSKLELKQLKNEIIDFYYNKKFISACSYCKGRDYGFGEIDAAIQTKKPLTFQKTI